MVRSVIADPFGQFKAPPEVEQRGVALIGTVNVGELFGQVETRAQRKFFAAQFVLSESIRASRRAAYSPAMGDRPVEPAEQLLQSGFVVTENRKRR